MKVIGTLVAALVAMAVLQPAAAHAAPDSEPFARVAFPLPPNNPSGTLVRMQIQGSADDWGLRTFAKTMDVRFAGLRVRTHGTCAERPGWTCVTVTTASWAPDEQVTFAGLNFMAATDNQRSDQRAVYLNTYYTPASTYAVAAHEFGHVLGLNHHQQDGICGAIPDQTALSWAEDKALRPYYGRLMSGPRN